MQLTPFDWALIALYFALSLWIGLRGSRKSGSSAGEFFLSGRSMPWWLLGVSMVATTFSCDTPNLVTDIVRQNGVAGNWAWWAFLLTGMLTVFVYARLWRRSGVLTDLEFYELRYSGPEARFLRVFRALYLGVFFNVMIMATVSLAAIKIGQVLFNVSPLTTLLLSAVVTVAYSAVGGFRSVLLTDFFQFFIAMIGSIGAAVVVLRLPEVGGLSGLFQHPNVSGKLALLPDFSDTRTLVPLLIVPLAVQWWSVWYPGAEPGGGGYVAQRMLAAKNEEHAVGAVLFFNVAHYALRPWPWILVGLASLIVFPTLADLKGAFPHIADDKLGHDLGYPAMLHYMPAGLAGLVVASLAAAYMSTLATHLNWGASYIVNDFYRRVVAPEADDKKLVLVGRLSTVLLMALAAGVALLLSSALDSFNILLQIGAGTGLLFILRWFWWRINAWSELSAMAISFVLAVYFRLMHPHTGLPALADWQQLLLGVSVTTAVWVLVTLLTRPTEHETLVSFFKHIRPETAGWRPVIEKGLRDGVISPEEAKGGGRLPLQIAGMALGCLTVYAALFATGYALYGNWAAFGVALVVTVGGAVGLRRLWGAA
ncbi:MAG: sodium:solute symporter family protein [Saprospiraceae bacterium]|nr:sodium:solute symporter family protein [Saprospiraceae bacterium]